MTPYIHSFIYNRNLCILIHFSPDIFMCTIKSMDMSFESIVFCFFLQKCSFVCLSGIHHISSLYLICCWCVGPYDCEALAAIRIWCLFELKRPITEQLKWSLLPFIKCNRKTSADHVTVPLMDNAGVCAIVHWGHRSAASLSPHSLSRSLAVKTLHMPTV